MRLLRALRAVFHAWMALQVGRWAEWHDDRASEAMARVRQGLRPPELFAHRANSSLSAADLFLLASIVGVGVAGVWVGMVWRAM
ncbi:hypothetical protein GGQ99_005067 [Aminobacter niigataensis]|uniref:Uncharacterized protein n=1 Tax=Aminobacter niigataensis TaxID=83265 RepID=A0ABR6L8Z5_9HYPH|nr:hypothetical protein [Aminobacter niigataensis]